MRFYDAHNHLQDERLAAVRQDVVATAARGGVVRMVVNGSCEEDWPIVTQLAREHPVVLPSFGYHPWYLRERSPDWQSVLVHALDEVSASVGEIGLDRWKAELSYEGQEDAFVWQLRLAAERNVAASIHCLQVWGRLHQLLRENPRPACGFLLHSYGGPKEMVEPLAKLGAFFSFPGYFIHERKTRQREAFRHVPLERLLIETDAPDQPLPDSHNRFPLHDRTGKPMNHPANIVSVYEFMSNERSIGLSEFAGHVEENFNRLFGN